MASFTQVNPVGGTVLTIRDTLQIRGFKLQLDSGSFTAGLTGTARKVGDEFGTTGALVDFKDGAFVFIGDAHALDIETVGRRASMVLGGTGTRASAGVYDIASAGTVTVTAITDLFGITGA